MRRSSSAVIAGLAVAALAAPAALNLPSASAAPPDRDPVAKGLLGVGADHDIDRRRGEVRPTAAQEAAAGRSPGEVRWNEYGTPASVVADRPLARDLPASPDRSARAY
ncbi:MAG TPA: hypothetical protein VFJ83_16565, partial [Nocardioidaceae bacterium]|nr:hypothetical protein [Nocardioidaceae bacterium]